MASMRTLNNVTYIHTHIPYFPPRKTYPIISKESLPIQEPTYFKVLKGMAISGGGMGLKSSYEEGKTVNVTSTVFVISKRICFVSVKFHSHMCSKEQNIVSFPCKFLF